MTLRSDLFLDTDLVVWAPCGCWMSVMVEYKDPVENAEATVEFIRDNIERKVGGEVRLERMKHSDFAALKQPDCTHDPKWGGVTSTHGYCPQCSRLLKKKKDGTFVKHGGYVPCSQEPRPRVTT